MTTTQALYMWIGLLTHAKRAQQDENFLSLSLWKEIHGEVLLLRWKQFNYTAELYSRKGSEV